MKPSVRVIIGVLLTLASAAQAQLYITISGQVRDAATGKPVPFASVYRNASTHGTTSDQAGNYQLTGVPVGTVDIVASSVGYTVRRQTIRIGNGQNQVLNFALLPDVKALQTINVTAKRLASYARLLRQFKKEILGTTAFADKCVISNLDRVVVTMREGQLEAQAAEPLIIDNNALGYRLYYTLTHFDSFRQATHYAGTSRFEALVPNSEEQAQRWERNRLKAYQGSIRHLLTSLLAGTHEQEGFLVYQANFDVPPNASMPIAQLVSQRPTIPVRSDSLFKPGQLPFERQLVNSRPLEIFYTRKHVIATPYRDLPYAYSILYLPRRTAVITTEGWTVQPNGMEVRGAMSDDRLATLLPLDWKPAGQQVKIIPRILDKGIILPADTVVNLLANQWASKQETMAPSAFLHLDKSLYLSGDRIWFSGYVLDPSTHQPLENADSLPALHVDLVAQGGHRVAHQWARIVNGRVAGNFRLSDSLRTGYYRLLAYSDLDRNGTRPAFEQRLSIINGLSPGVLLRSVDSIVATDHVDVQFLPEGGHWVSGLPARIGIKAINKQGAGLAISGRVVSTQGTEMGRFVTNRWGMGSIQFTPVATQRYRAEMHTPTDSLVALLPPVDSSGLVLGADIVTDSTQLTIGIQASPSLAFQPVYLIIQSRGQLVQRVKLQLQEGQARLSIPAVKLPIGLVQITLFDWRGMPRVERLVFIPERALPIVATATTDKTHYQARESIGLSVQIADGFGEPLSIIGSASVTDADQVPTDTTQATIVTHLLLTSELRGQVEDAHLYLNNNHFTTRRALDDLLLTQGWRRYSWRFMTDQPNPKVTVAAGLSIRGQVVDRKNRAVPQATVLVTFTSKKGDSFARSARSDQNGRVVIGDLVLVDTVRVQTQVMTAGFEPIPAARLLIDSPGNSFRSPDSSVVTGLTALTPFLRAMQQRQASDPDQYRDKSVRELAAVTVRAVKATDDFQARRISLHSSADVTIRFDERSRPFENAYEMLLGTAAGVQVRRKAPTETGGGSGGYTVTVRGASSFSEKNPPLYLVDGNYVTENDEGTALLMVNPTDVERIEILKNGVGAVYGARGGGGVIAFYFKRSGSQRTVFPKNAVSTLYGYPTEQQFYVPRYEKDSELITNRPDRRDVLYWKPLLSSDRLGTTSLRFLLSDVAHTLRITIQGITVDGRPVYMSQLIKVR